MINFLENVVGVLLIVGMIPIVLVFSLIARITYVDPRDDYLYE